MVVIIVVEAGRWIVSSVLVSHHMMWKGESIENEYDIDFLFQLLETFSCPAYLLCVRWLFDLSSSSSSSISTMTKKRTRGGGMTHYQPWQSQRTQNAEWPKERIIYYFPSPNKDYLLFSRQSPQQTFCLCAAERHRDWQCYLFQAPQIDSMDTHDEMVVSMSQSGSVWN